MRILDDRLAAGFLGGAAWLTSIVSMAGGGERRNQRRTIAPHEYTFSYANRDIVDCRAIKDFHMDMRGQKTPWLLHDFADDIAQRVLLGTGNGVTAAFQAKITYGTEAPYARAIRHVMPGYQVYVNDVLVTVDSEASGLFTLQAAPANGALVRATFGFWVPVRFTVDRLDIEVVGKEGRIGRIANLGAREVLP